jgi:hypothetical protein
MSDKQVTKFHLKYLGLQWQWALERHMLQKTWAGFLAHFSRVSLIFRPGSMPQVVEYLPGKGEALNSISSTEKKISDFLR